MKRITALTAAITLTVVGLARSQAPNVQPAGSPYQLPYPPKQPSQPVAPQATTRPESWPGGPVPAVPIAAAPPQLTPEQAASPWLKSKLPEKFTGTEIIARVGTEVILASEALPRVEETVQKAIASRQFPESRASELRYHLMQQNLQQLISIKLLLIEAKREIPKENLEKIRKKVNEFFDKEYLPKMIDGTKIKSRAELIAMLREGGTSIEEQQQQFFESSLAKEVARKHVGEDKEITHEEMLSYYREHLKDYETQPRTRWEHLMVKFANYPAKADAWGKIAGWGNEIQSGVPFADVAKRHSDDPSNAEGGMHDWTSQGSLASETLDQAIFALPIGSLSAILEDQLGFHIIRVVQREGLTRKPFSELQDEIKKKIKEERKGADQQKYLAELRKKIPIWTIFDDLPQPKDESAAQ